MKWVVGLVVIIWLLGAWHGMRTAPVVAAPPDAQTTKANRASAETLADKLLRPWRGNDVKLVMEQVRAQGPEIQREVELNLLLAYAGTNDRWTRKSADEALALLGVKDSMLHDVARLCESGAIGPWRGGELIRATIRDEEEAVALWCEQLTDAEPRQTELLARALRKGDIRFRTDVLAKLLRRESPLSFRLIHTINPDPIRSRQHAAALLVGKEEVHKNALTLCAVVGVDTPELTQRMNKLLRDPDPDIRSLAAMALNTMAAFNRAAVPGVLEALRDDKPVRRVEAAHRLSLMDLFDPRITAALIRATEQRDPLAREGLVAAIESAFGSDLDAMSSLQRSAHEGDNDQRLRARAALRELGLQPRTP